MDQRLADYSIPVLCIISASTGLLLRDISPSALQRLVQIYSRIIPLSDRRRFEATLSLEIRRRISREHCDMYSWFSCVASSESLSEVESLFRVANIHSDREIWRQYFIEVWTDDMFIGYIFPQGAFMPGEPSLDYPLWDTPPRLANS